MRKSEMAGRSGKQPDGSAKTREAKLVTMWTAESRDEEGKPVRDPGSITYSAAIESATTLDTCPERSEFAERVLREATRRGFTDASRCVVLGDGSAWISGTPPRNRSRKAIQILDRFHAKEHLGKVGKAIYGDNEPGKKWIHRRDDELDEGRMKSLLKALDRHTPKYEEALECADYFRNDRDRVRYPEFHE